jgi:hypothetical protein
MDLVLPHKPGRLLTRLPFLGWGTGESMAYTIEQQKMDLVILDATRDALSARTIGEKRELLEAYVLDYVRISRMWANKPHSNPGMVKYCARMFNNLAFSERITAWDMARYGQLIYATRKMIRDSIFRRAKAKPPCAFPYRHTQPCYCLNLQRSKERTAGIDLEKAILEDLIPAEEV